VRRGRIGIACGVGGLLALPAAACANPLSGLIWRDYGFGWWLVVTALIVAVEWPLFAWIGRWHWGWSLVGVIVANVASTFLLGAFGVPNYLPPTLLLTVAVEAGVIALLAWPLAWRGLAPPKQLLGAVFAMNAASFLIAPVVSGFLAPRDTKPLCMSNLKKIGAALSVYTADNDRALPPVRTAAELRGFLAGKTPTELSWHCPQLASQWTLSDREPTRLNYELFLPLPDRLADEIVTVHRRPDGRRSWTERRYPEPWRVGRVLMADDAPRHGGMIGRAGGASGRVCLYYDWHAKWVKEADVAAMVGAGPEATHAPGDTTSANRTDRP
jgi:hypothetical protein